MERVGGVVRILRGLAYPVSRSRTRSRIDDQPTRPDDARGGIEPGGAVNVVVRLDGVRALDVPYLADAPTGDTT